MPGQNISPPHLKKEPAWPVSYSAPGLSVAVGEHDGVLLGCVGAGVDQDHTIVAINTGTLDIMGDESDPSWRFAAGVALSWFIDVSIAIAAASSDHYRPVRPGRKSGTRTIRYEPTPTFLRYEQAIRTGRADPIVAHRVKGFVRRVPRGQRPSLEARSNAPTHIRRHLKANETFVREHSRGGEQESLRLRTHLSQHSMLAEMLGLAFT